MRRSEGKRRGEKEREGRGRELREGMDGRGEKGRQTDRQTIFISTRNLFNYIELVSNTAVLRNN